MSLWHKRFRLGIAAALVVFGMQASGGARQTPAQSDLAEKMTGRWLLNKGLSSLADPGSGGGGRRGGGPSFARAGAVQRGGGGGTAPEPPSQMPSLTTAEAAAQAALAIVQQLPPEITIEATAVRVRFVEPRGESVFQVDGKNAPVPVPGGSLKVKSKWDRASLRQEFSSTQRVLHRSWSLDDAGRLLLAQRMEGLGFKPRESRAVFERQ